MFRPRNKGAVLIVSIIFIVIFSALAFSMATLSGTSVQIADNQRKIDAARACAESGLEIMRFWFDRVLIPSSTAQSDYLSTIVDYLNSDLTANQISNIIVSQSGSIPTVTLDSATGRTFEAQIQHDPNTPTILQVYITGYYGEITRTIRVNFYIEPYEFPIFNYGLATKGPLNFPGNPTVRGVNDNWEADIYVESPNDLTALYVGGNTNFDGDISIGNEDANATFDGDVLIAGEHGQTAIDNHVFTGADQVEFPVPDTSRFQQYATGNIIDSTTDISKGMTLTNATIATGTDPNFGGSVIIEGILLVEPPNIVRFSRNVMLNGMIVAEGDVNNPGTNELIVCGNFATGPYPPDPQFDVMRDEIGTSILAPGFSASFQGNFATLDGVMAVSGLHVSGNANAVVKGTILSYSDSPVVIEGNATMNFDRAGSTKVPAGFDFYRELNYDPNSYSEICSGSS